MTQNDKIHLIERKERSVGTPRVNVVGNACVIEKKGIVIVYPHPSNTNLHS